ncbi:hypothetical protein [Streptomyces werraensis]|uniref:hypothetical protein n=1 Tax=Streptomyces werraensis TaxID=68284 RepID=UPI00369337B6
MRTYDEINAAYEARRAVPFGFKEANFFGNLDILTLKGTERAGACQASKCTLPAPVELVGHVKGEVSGCKLTRTRRTCAFHFWEILNEVLWLDRNP